MGYCRQTSLPVAEPVSLSQAKSFLRLPPGYVSEDETVQAFIAAAREQGELITGYCLAQRTWTQVMDRFPSNLDYNWSNRAYSGSNYTLLDWDHSQVIKLSYPPIISVQGIQYVGANGIAQTLQQDIDFILDRITTPVRLFPAFGGYWPPALYVANSLQINYTAGYDPDPKKIVIHGASGHPPITLMNQQPDSTIVSGVPQMIILGILNLVAFWFNNRGSVGLVPDNIERIFQQQAIVDFAPMRG